MVRLLLVKGNSFVSKIVKSITKSEYSHCGFLFGTTTVEADFGGVQVRYIGNYPWPYEVREIKGMTWDKHYALHKWCLSQLGKPYDYMKIIGLFFELVFHFSRLRSLLKSKNAFHCSEFVAEGLRHVGLDLGTATEVMTPSSISCASLLHDVRVVTHKL